MKPDEKNRDRDMTYLIMKTCNENWDQSDYRLVDEISHSTKNRFRQWTR